MKMRQITYKWKNLTVEMINELWTAHEVLAKEGRPKTVSNVTVKTWSDYCEAIGISRMTAHRWLYAYDPKKKELPHDLLIDRSEKEERTYDKLINRERSEVQLPYVTTETVEKEKEKIKLVEEQEEFED